MNFVYLQEEKKNITKVMVSSSNLLQLLVLTLTVPLIYATNAQRNPNISLGSSLTPLGPNTYWLSPSEDFAFGFYPLETNSNNFLLAIWFAKIPTKTIVWYANGNNPVNSGARLELTNDGQLSLEDNTKNVVWSSDKNCKGSSYAAMLNNGNFIIVDANNSIIWQSFKEPTDTILPFQALDLGTNLVDRLMDDNFSTGRFALSFSSKRNHGLYTVLRSSYSQLSTGLYHEYWSIYTTPAGSQLIYDPSGTIYIYTGTELNLTIISSKVGSDQEFYQRATMDTDGVFRQYVYPKNRSRSQEWSVVAFMPGDICQESFPTDMGSGICGFNSYCVTGPVKYNYSCKCLPQHHFVDPYRKYKGCVPDFRPQNCLVTESESLQLFRIEVLPNVDFVYFEYEAFNQIDEDTCKRECLVDCFCAVAVYNNFTCAKKMFRLSNGRHYYSSDSSIKSFVKVVATFQQHDESKRIWMVAGLTILGISAVLNFFLILKLVYNSCLFINKTSNVQSDSDLPLLMSLRTFSYRELEEATNGFSEELGSGTFAVVYKGILQDEATCIAVKKLNKFFPEVEREFMNEVKAISQVYHKNLVRMIGICNEGDKRLLIYEFMSNGTLAQVLHGEVRPEWNRRIQIALGIARGLAYLHQECMSQIIHCDIKPQNILLDENYVAKISDFGLSKLLKTDQSRTSTHARGTRGYVAPEWFKNKAITTKVDVYSFGILLLEIICCRRNVKPELENEEQTILSYWVDDCYRDGKLDLVVHGDEEAKFDMQTVERFVKVAIWCIQEEPSLRPTMTKVTQMLDGAESVPIPPDLGSYISSIS